MTYQEFVDQTVKAVENKLPDHIKVNLSKIPFNNNVNKDGVSFSCEDTDISPLIYLNNYYDAYKKNYLSVDSAAADIVSKYKNAVSELSIKDDAITDFESAKDRIVYRLINRESNRSLLKNMPHIPYLDLAITFALMLSVNDENEGSIRIGDKLMEVWGKTESELWDIASANTSKLLPPLHTSMRSLLEQTIPKISAEFDPLYPDPDDLALPMTVLSNTTHLHGASTMLYKGLMKKIHSKFKENFYILPSSIHEVILVPESCSPERDYIDKIINSCNSYVVSQEEYLSDHAYYYNGSLDCIEY